MAAFSHLLAAWGRLMVRWRWAVLVAWLAVFVGAGSVAGKLPTLLQSGTGSLRGTASAAAEQAVQAQFRNPYTLGLALTLRHPRERADGPEMRAVVAELASRLRGHPAVARVLAPGDPGSRAFRSRDPQGCILLLGLSARDLASAEQVVAPLRAMVAETLATKAPGAGIVWHVTGRPALTHDINAFSTVDSARAEARSLPLTAVVLVLAFGSLLAAALPLAVGTVAIVVASGLLVVLAQLTALSTYTQSVASMLGLALGIDYALLMVTRFREALRRGRGVEAAVVETVATAGRAVVISGLTVVIGFGGLVTTEVLDSRSMGVGGLLVAGVSVALALTLIPALMTLAGPRLTASWAVLAQRREARLARWVAWAQLVSRHPWRLGAAAVGLLLLLIAPLAAIRTGYPTGRWMPQAMPYVQGLDALTAMGQAGLVAPIDLVLRAREGQAGALSATQVPTLLAYSQALHADARVAAVLSPVDLDPPVPAGVLTMFYARPAVAERTVPLVRELFFSEDGRAALFQVLLRNDLTFEESRAMAADLSRRPPPGFDVLVGGQAAYFNDFDVVLDQTLPRVVAFVVTATCLALGVAYRSVLVPLKAVVLNLLSVGAGLGAVVAVFQFGWGIAWLGHAHPLDHVPLTVALSLFCIVFGLSMDYEVFLLTRIKEAWDRGATSEAATVEGVSATAGLVTSAAAVMVCVFGAFSAADFAVVQMLGLGLAVAVAVDATLVRMILLPAAMALLGDWNWWPGQRRPPVTDPTIGG
ncbi:MAG: MMPL family transporter [Candidatus Sericytochromatia bacterium]|nr:MMPL family transporter [Candidatus Sericytochromatia bacterium]